MKQGNPLLKGCLYFFGGIFLLALLVQLAIPLAICAALGFGGYYLYRRWRYPLLQDHSLQDQIELLKARIGQADQDIHQLEVATDEQYRSLARQVLIEIDGIHKEANRLKHYLEEGVYQRIDKKVRSVRAEIQVRLEKIDYISKVVQTEPLSPQELAPELRQTLDNIAIDHQAILDKIAASDSGNKEELTALHQMDMERFEKILDGYLKIKAEPKNYKNAEERLAQAKAALEQFDLELDETLQELNEADLRDFDISLRILNKKKEDPIL